jgi:hypothetical protein
LASEIIYASKTRKINVPFQEQTPEYYITPISSKDRQYFIDITDNALTITPDYISTCFDQLKNQQITLCPIENKMVDQAPITINIVTPPRDINLLSNACSSVVLDWTLRRWGHLIAGPQKQLRYSPHMVFTIDPQDIKTTRRQIDTSKKPFDGYS